MAKYFVTCTASFDYEVEADSLREAEDMGIQLFMDDIGEPEIDTEVWLLDEEE